MPIKIGQGFERTSKSPIDLSLVLSKAEMLAINEELMPDTYFAVCSDDGKLYTYNKSNTVDSVTGKYRLAEGNTESMELTQEQYNALSSEERLNGTVYFIKDADIVYNAIRTEKVLFTNTANMTGQQVMQLSEPITADKFDYIIVRIGVGTDLSTRRHEVVLKTSDVLAKTYQTVKSYQSTDVNGSGVITIRGRDDGNMEVFQVDRGSSWTNIDFGVYEIVGVKYVAASGGGGSSIQVDALPTASAEEEGNIYQYIGVTDSVYKNGYFYQCAEITPSTTPKTYRWDRKDTQPSSGGGDASFEIDKTNDWANITANGQHLSFTFDNTDMVAITAADPGTYYAERRLATTDYVDSHAGNSIQVTSLPAASATEEGKVYQYIGTTTSTYTNGYFYQCVEITPATDPKTYKWVQKNVQTGGGYDDTELRNRITTVEKEKATGYFERTDFDIPLNTAGQPAFALAKDSFKIEVENHKPYTYEFTAGDVYNLAFYNETIGKTFILRNEDNETIHVKMTGSLPDNVQYAPVSSNPVLDFTSAVATLTKTTFLRQIDEMLIPAASGEVFIFDVNGDDFTEDPQNPGGKHYGVTLTSPTFDEIMDNLVSDKLVFAKVNFNSGNSSEMYQLFRTSSSSIRGKAFDLEFPQGYIWFYDIYVQKRNFETTTYFGMFADKVSDGGGGGNSEVITKGTTTQAQVKAAMNKELWFVDPAANYAPRPVLFCRVDEEDNTKVELAVFKDERNSDLWVVADDDTWSLGGTVYFADQNDIGDLANLTTTANTNLVAAINELKFAIDGLGEPFRVKQWAGSWSAGVNIPVCTSDMSNTAIPKMVYSIDDVEGADYQIVGMLAYEVFDNTSGGNRLNVWPVCQFTGNGQKELSVRWCCMGTTDKLAKRINGWVLLKHR